MKITVFILTFNEELHLERCIKSILPLTSDIIIIDSFSTDSTVNIANRYGLIVLQNAWENNHSTQFNWALKQLKTGLVQNDDWLMRIDADEVISPGLIIELKERLPRLGKDVKGVYFYRKMKFLGHLIQYGGVGSNKVLRLFRFGYGQSESRWMDEHIWVNGKYENLVGSIIDDNLNSLAWWINKHNNYASREAADLLNLKYQLEDIKEPILKHFPNSGKRWIKEVIYAKLPGGTRAAAYFIYRYLFLLGFMDGKVGRQFHYLQAFWYRYLVDAKLAEVERYMKTAKLSAKEAIRQKLDLKP